MKNLSLFLVLFGSFYAMISALPPIKPQKLTTFKSQLRKYFNFPSRTCNCSAFEGKTMAMVCGGSSYSPFMDILEQYLQSQCDLVDPTRCGTDVYVDEVDFVVVGAGAAGSVVASRLSENQNDHILLLEAGGPAPTATQVPGMYFTYDRYPEIDWNFALQPQKYACWSQGGVCRWPRGKVMGGTTILHGMMYMRGYPQDFDELKLKGWSWNDVMKYYLKSEDNRQIGTYADAKFHATGGYLTVQQFADTPNLAKDILSAAIEYGYPAGHDMNGNIRTGFTVAQATTKDGVRLSAAKAFLYNPNVFFRPNLQIRTNAYVTRVLINETNNVAYGVEYIKEGRTYSIRARKEVILSAGTVQSPQILMLSGIGPKKHLKNIGIKVIHDLPGVGRNLKNHASFSVVYKVMDDSGTSPINNETIRQFHTERKGPLTSTGLSQLTGFLYSRYANISSDPPDIQVFFGGYLANCTKTGSPVELTTPGITERRITITPTLLRPKSVGYLELRDRFPQSPPKIYANLLEHNHDVSIIREGIRKIQDLVRSTKLRHKLTLDTTTIDACTMPFDSDSYWECAMRWFTNPENHQVGTCKMGTSQDPMAVTDELLRVRGIQNLRVIDASVFPNVPSGNIVAPTIMAGEKGADLIKATWPIFDSPFF